MTVSDLPRITKDGKASQAEQVFGFYRDAIAAGRLRAGDRLPPIRAVADLAGVTRGAVQAAYRRLADDGLVRATVGRGTEVVGPAGRRLVSPAAEAALRHAQAAGGAALDAVPDAHQAAGERTRGRRSRRRSPVADFATLQPDPADFPVAEFRASIDRVLRDRGAELLAYAGDPAGHGPLRELLAERHGAGSPDRVLVTSGAQQGLELVMRTFTSPGDAVAVAVPTYHQLLGMLEAHGRTLVPIPAPGGTAGGDAVRRALERSDVRLLYVMPSFHNPTGATLDTAQREELMAAVAETDVPVLEDEVECELRLAGEAWPSLASLDPRGRTATVRSFSKGLFPGVRLGWVEADVAILRPMQALKRFSDLESSPLLQAAIADLVARGDFDRHVAAFRVRLRERHAAADAALRRELPDGCRYAPPEGGMSLWVELPGRVPARRVAARAAEQAVWTTPGDLFDPTGASDHGLRLALSRTAPPEIAAGIAILAACIAAEIGAGAGSLEPPLIL